MGKRFAKAWQGRKSSPAHRTQGSLSYRVIKWFNFNLVSQGIGMPKERDRDSETTGWWSSQYTLNIYELSLLSYIGAVCNAPTISNIKDH